MLALKRFSSSARLSMGHVLSVFGLVAVVGVAAVGQGQAPADEVFVRGDANLDGRVTIADVFTILRHVYAGRGLSCLDAADADASGLVDQFDFLHLIGVLFRRGGHRLAQPYPEPGTDTRPGRLGCEAGLPQRREAIRGQVPDRGDEEARHPVEERGLHGVGERCIEEGGGADLELIHFNQDHTYAFPGQRRLSMPILLLSIDGDIEGLTLAVEADPEFVTLESLRFTGQYIEEQLTRSSWIYSYGELREEGYLATTLVLDLEDGLRTIPPTIHKAIAELVISVPEAAPEGFFTTVRFSRLPGRNDLPEIPTEIVRDGFSGMHAECSLTVEIESEDDLFLRGDVTRDRRLNLSDVLSILRYLFGGTFAGVTCRDAADVDDSGQIEINDVVHLVRYLFLQGTPPLPPFPNPGMDITPGDGLDCRP
jgi:hypothetical protein